MPRLPALEALFVAALSACAPPPARPVGEPSPTPSSAASVDAPPALARSADPESTESAAVAPALEPLALSPLPSPAVAPPTPPRRFVDVEVGYQQSCARRADGSVACWPHRGAARDVAGVKDAVAIALMDSSLCVAHRGGRVTCRSPDGDRSVPALDGAAALRVRGYDLCGELGPDTVCVTLHTGEVRSRHPNAGGLAYESNEGGTCFIEAGGGLRCFGKLAGLGGRSFTGVTDVAVTTVQGCAIDKGHLYCFRGEDRGLDVFLGDGRGTRGSPEVVQLGLPAPEQVEVVGGFAPTTCVRSRDGRVWCWGGTAELYDREVPVNRPLEIPGLRAVDISGDGGQMCAVTTAGQIACMGSRAPYQGDVVVPQVRGAVELATGYGATCARADAGMVWCWGELSIEGTDRRLFAPTAIDAAKGLANLVLVRRGLCGADADGPRCLDDETLAWAGTTRGMRLVANREQACVTDGEGLRCRQGEIETLRGADRYAIGGDDLFCGLYGREVRCVRAPMRCEADGGCRYASSAPFGVLSAASEVRAVHVSTVHTAKGRTQVVCLVEQTGQPRCARIRGTKVQRDPDAFPPGFPSAVRALRLKGREACGITDDSVVCAQLWEPEAIEGYRVEATDIGLGSRHSCVLLRDGRVTCWGQNENGQRGLGGRWNVADPALAP